MLHEIGSEHSHPPELGARIDPSGEAVLAAAPVVLIMDIRAGFEPPTKNDQLWFHTTLALKDLWK